jgi:hypothetical protein
MPREPDEYEQAWAQIVADLTTDDPGLASRALSPEAPEPDTGDPGGEDRRAADPSSLDTDDLPAAAGSGSDAPEEGSGTEAGTHPAAPGAGEATAGVPVPTSRNADVGNGRTADQDAYHPSDWADEGHFVPPPPPDLPAGTPASRLGWAGVVGGPAVMAFSALFGWHPPHVVLWGAGVATVAGFVTLIWQLPDSRADGWDEGAQL